MKVAWHMTRNSVKDFPHGFMQELNTIYAETSSEDLYWDEARSSLDRIYVGDEFCPTRLPTPQELSCLCGFTEQKNLSLTLLTPVLTDQGIEHCTPLFDRLNQWNPEAEVVVNDLGVLFFLKKQYPNFQLSMGRLFNRGFKDPRLKDKDFAASEEMGGLLNDCSFRHENLQVLAENLGVHRLEQDLLPYADPGFVTPSRLKTAVYFPFGYVTTGRVCFTAGLNQTPGNRFRLAGKCSSPCATQSLLLKHSNLAFKLFQNGNTIFYQYTPAMLRSLFENARHHGLRLVYQGGLL
ncbi:hypothetical protein [Desulfobacula phenolica]|uniref:Uncharacterized protein n=1 Tax=Desulfobacula phenolica TaxID=90732 RepID=A0A1H2IB33_9BACT|nr:hypothetical protein [Desulfobacula phenolica]SDU41058.1 hypothetical protein SAMN04487931_10831 [Desulfobacula phenolica]